MRVIAAELPIHDDELPSIGAIVGALGIVALAIVALTFVPTGRGEIDDDARGVIRRGTFVFEHQPVRPSRHPPFSQRASDVEAGAVAKAALAAAIARPGARAHEVEHTHAADARPVAPAVDNAVKTSPFDVADKSHANVLSLPIDRAVVVGDDVPPEIRASLLQPLPRRAQRLEAYALTAPDAFVEREHGQFPSASVTLGKPLVDTDDSLRARVRPMPDLVDVDLRVATPPDDDSLAPRPRPRIPDPAPYEPFICIYPGFDYRDFREAVRRAVLTCAYHDLWGTVAHDARGFHVDVHNGAYPLEARCIEAALDRTAPRMLDEVSAPFFYTPDVTSRTDPTPGSSARPPP